MRQLAVGFLLLSIAALRQPAGEPTVRIGLTQNATAVTIRSASPFTVEQHATRVATFAPVLALDPARSGPVAKTDLQYRMTVTLEGDVMLVMPAGAHVRIEAPA